jgi:hypothetical protein
MALAFVEASEPCPDVAASLSRLQREASIVRSHLALLRRNGKARASLGRLERKLVELNKKIGAERIRLNACEQGVGKASAAAACDAEGRSAAQAAGTVAGLADVLPTERRLAARIRGLRPLATSTRKQLVAARASATRATQRLVACDASLMQG